MIKYTFFIFICLLITNGLSAQKLSVPELQKMLDWSFKRIDTTLKNHDYLLMQKDIDSASALYQYSQVEKKDDAPVTIHSFTYMDAAAGGYKSRLITYRTYSKDEYAEIASYLLANNYHITNKYDFKGEKHAVYSNGQQTIRVKTIVVTLKDKRTFTAYELEIGK